MNNTVISACLLDSLHLQNKQEQLHLHLDISKSSADITSVQLKQYPWKNPGGWEVYC